MNPDQSSGTGEIQELRLSNDEIRFMERAQDGTRYLREMCLGGNPGQNETYEVTRKIHTELLASIVLFITSFDNTSAEGPALFCNHILKFYYEQFLPVMSERPLLTGDDIIHQFRLSPSPVFGKILNSVQKAQVLGNITTREDAIALAENLIQSKNEESNG